MAHNRRDKHNPSTHSNSYNHDVETKIDEDTMISFQLNEVKTEWKKLGGLKDLPSIFESFENQLSDILNEITTIRSNMDHLKEENAQLKKRNRDLEEKMPNWTLNSMN